MDRQNKSITDKVDGGISKHIGNYSDAVTATVTDPAYIELYVAARKEIPGDLKPALMLSVVHQTFKPEIMVEIEAVAYGVPGDEK